MALQKVEFEFPDPDKPATGGVDVDISTPEDKLPAEKAPKTPAPKGDDLEIEVVDDTPPKDRNRKKSEPPAEVTDEELTEYSEKVKKRLQHFSKGYHDERREKEKALREREELERYARTLLEENKQLKTNTDRSHNTLIEQAKQQVTLELDAAKKQYKEAYEAGDADRLLAAQEALTTAKIRADKVAGLKPKALQTEPAAVQQDQTQPQRVAAQQQAPQKDPKAEAWRNENTWFGSDDEMTAFALGYHTKLLKEGVNPRSDEYYEKLNSRMRKVFPEAFDDAEGDELEAEKPKAKAATVVAPATRSVAPRKVRLTETQVATAKRLGVPLEEYAKQVAILQRK